MLHSRIFLTIRRTLGHIWIIAFWLSLQDAWITHFSWHVTHSFFSVPFRQSPNAFSAEKRLEIWLKTLIVFLFFPFCLLTDHDNLFHVQVMLLDINWRLVMIHLKQLSFIFSPKYRPCNAIRSLNYSLHNVQMQHRVPWRFFRGNFSEYGHFHIDRFLIILITKWLLLFLGFS